MDDDIAISTTLIIIMGAFLIGFIGLLFVVTGMATIWLAHIFLGAPEYTSWGMRFLVGVAMTLIFGGSIIAALIRAATKDD